MTLEIDERSIESTLDGMKRMSEDRKSASNPYSALYSDYIKAYSDIGLYITFLNGKHVVSKMSDM